MTAFLRRLALVILVTSVFSGRVQAQASTYPSFQLPRVASRELNFGLASGGGTTIFGQWREGYGVRSQLSAEVGFTSLSGATDETLIFFGGGYAYQLLTETPTRPVDLLFTLGAGVGLCCDATFIHVPVGVSVGKRFPMEGAMTLTPFAHPHLAIDHGSAGGASETEINLNVDLGVDLSFSPTLSARAGAGFGGSYNDTSVGLSVAWKPARR